MRANAVGVNFRGKSGEDGEDGDVVFYDYLKKSVNRLEKRENIFGFRYFFLPPIEIILTILTISEKMF